MTTRAGAAPCPKCGSACPEGFRFCGACGAQLTSPETERAERRQLTVLFCDLADSTALSERLDPEELREVVRAYQSACAGPIERFEGHIAQYLGDGLLVYFGYPEAHEDDARRSLLAALAMLQSMARLNATRMKERGLRLSVRIGIHTGPVVTGEVGAGSRREHLAVGQTPNIAARLQGLAELDSIVLSGATYRLARGFFQFEALGERMLKGISAPMDVYRAVRESGAHSRFEAERVHGLSPLVGRQRELNALVECFQAAREGRGQCVLVEGEAGVGKSRLLHQFGERLSEHAHVLRVCRCSFFDRSSAFQPVVDLLKSVCQWRDEDSPERKGALLEERLRHFGLPLEEAVPLFAGLLGLPLGEAYAAPRLTPRMQNQRTQELLVALVVAQARARPVVLVVEDLHWADPSTRELLRLLMERAREVPLLLVMTTRPPWDDETGMLRLRLPAFTDEEATQLVLGLTGGLMLPPQVLRQVLQKADGIPLFVEELTRTLLTSGLLQREETALVPRRPLPAMAIPATLQDALMARLDRHGDLKELAQLCSVLGREFSHDQLAAVCALDEPELRGKLQRLVEAGLLFENTRDGASYVFKHALLQDAASDSLLKSLRQDFHRRIAMTLEARFPRLTAEKPERLAHHLLGAGLSAQAVIWLCKAGQRALARWANLEAITHLELALRVLEGLPRGPERDEQELALQLTLGGAWTTSGRFWAPQVEHAYGRALELCGQLEDTPMHFWGLLGLWNFHHARANLDLALELSQRCLELAKRLGANDMLLSAYNAVGSTLSFRGELTEACAYLQTAVTLDDAHRHLPYAGTPVGEFGGVGARCDLAITLCRLGLHEEAVTHSQAAIQRAREIDSASSLAFAVTFASQLYQAMGDLARLRQHAQWALTISTEQGYFFQTLALFFLGTAAVGEALAHDGPDRDARLDEGRARMREGLESYRRMGARLSQSYMLAQLVEADLARGHLEAARTGLSEAFQAATSERYWLAELHRLSGVLARAEGGTFAEARAAESFQKALDVARSQGNRLFEQRALMELEGTRRAARA
ncbi:ATP-binding protein [Corallococcus interemptor]|uniref:ATP-binding protein n=1 Tax=Corallococcus interemptor TaxID=2316720 RepID=UPI003CFF8B22